MNKETSEISNLCKEQNNSLPSIEVPLEIFQLLTHQLEQDEERCRNIFNHLSIPPLTSSVRLNHYILTEKNKSTTELERVEIAIKRLQNKLEKVNFYSFSLYMQFYSEQLVEQYFHYYY